MAEMVPPRCSSDIPGELEIFRRLSGDPLANDWIVLHSVNLAHHMSQVEGEIDFVVIIPWRGVLCVEVKSHKNIYRDRDGMWYLGDEKPESRGPFRQASAAMHSLRSYLVGKDRKLSRVPFWSCVVMPFARFDASSPEWHSWQLVNEVRFKTHSFAKILLEIMASARELLKQSPTCTWFEPSQRHPDFDQCSKLRALIRGPGGEKPHFANRARDEAAEFTCEQVYALDAMSANQRVLFHGPAGTGKTVLASEAVRRGVKNGQRVLFVCFNHQLGDRLNKDLRDVPKAKVCTLHALMLGIVKIQPPDNADELFWRRDLPAATIGKLGDIAASSEEYVYDLLIVDEAQDIFLPDYLDVLSVCLKGGLTAGEWRIFGDFDHQAIYADDAHVPYSQFLTNRGGSPATFSLSVNCRNTPSIVKLLKVLAGPNPPYSRILRPDRVDPVCLGYLDQDDQRKKLVTSLEQAWNEGLRGSDIIVLSPKADGCAGKIVTPTWSDRLKPINVAQGDEIPWCTIHTFKGLEAAWVIITDIDDISSPQAQRLIYVALTRSLGNLTVLMSEKIKDQFVDIMLKSVLMS